jgi:hypothetical protein
MTDTTEIHRHSGQSRCSAPRTSGSRSPSPAEIPRRRSRPDCPVVVKAHEGHPQTSRITTEVIPRALADAGAPAGLLQTV